MNRLLYISRIWIALLGSALVLGACETVVTDVDIPAEPTSYVVNAWLSPEDTAHFVWVTETQPTFGVVRNQYDTRIPTVSGARVEFLPDNGGPVLASYDPIRRGYRLPINALYLEGGRSARIKVTPPEGPELLGSVRTPVDRNTSLKILLDSASLVERDSLSYYLTLDWTDLPGIGHYYQAVAWAEIEDENGKTRYRRFTGDVLNSIWTDEFTDGRQMRIRDLAMSITPEEKVQNIIAELYTTDASYYNFHRTLYRQGNDATNGFTNPTQMYSNVAGGRGAVGAYRIFTKVKPITR